MDTKDLEGRWGGTFYIRAGLATQAGTLDITVTLDGKFSGKALDNNVPEVVTGKFTTYPGAPGYSFQIHIYGPSYAGTAQLEADASLKMKGEGLTATLTRTTSASE